MGAVEEGPKSLVPMGVVAGLLTVLVFTVLHDLLISDIWFSLIPMLLAGALCGGSLAWSYGMFFRPPTGRAWVMFVSFQTAALLLLGLVSVLLFEPVVPMAVVIAANEPPTELITQAFPLTVVFIVCAAAAASLLWGRTARQFSASLLAEAVLILFLGLNVSALGLVEMSSDSPAVVAEFLGWIVFIMLMFGVLFSALRKTRLPRVRGSVPKAPVLLLLLLAACTTWQPMEPGPAPLPDRIRVTTGSGTLELRDPVIEADSVLVGVLVTGDAEQNGLPDPNRAHYRPFGMEEQWTEAT